MSVCRLFFLSETVLQRQIVCATWMKVVQPTIFLFWKRRHNSLNRFLPCCFLDLFFSHKKALKFSFNTKVLLSLTEFAAAIWACNITLSRSIFSYNWLDIRQSAILLFCNSFETTNVLHNMTKVDNTCHLLILNVTLQLYSEVVLVLFPQSIVHERKALKLSHIIIFTTFPQGRGMHFKRMHKEEVWPMQWELNNEGHAGEVNARFCLWPFIPYLLLVPLTA